MHSPSDAKYCADREVSHRNGSWPDHCHGKVDTDVRQHEEDLRCVMNFIESSQFMTWFSAEEGYLLTDQDNEEKYGFQLADALERARENKGKLFAGLTFLITSKVPVEPKLLKNVVVAGGGQVSLYCPHTC